MPDARQPASNSSPDDGKPAPPPCPYHDPDNAPLPKSGWLRRWPAVTYLLPFVLFMIVGSMEPSRVTAKDEAELKRLTHEIESGNAAEREIAQQELEKKKVELTHAVPYELYPRFYTGKIVITTLAMLAVLPGYLAFRTRVHGIAWVVGAVGAVVWIILAKFQVSLYPHLPGMLSKALEMGGRSGFNPLVEFKDNPTWAWGFLAIRFFGLVVVVAVIEEFFLRGFLMRYVMDVDWHLIPFGVVNRLALATVLIFPIIYHPERLAAAVWFGMVTWLMLRTKSIWDCVIAHAVTNLLMGLWVVWSGDWWMM